MTGVETLLPSWLRCVRLLKTGPCHGKLRQQDDAFLCNRCKHHYARDEGIPLFIVPKKDEDHDHYDNEVIIRTYYETQYGPFIRPLKGHLPLPQPHAPLQPKVALPPTPRSARMLMQATSLTETFYQTVIELCLPHLRDKMHILDIGCGLGRITGELALRTNGTVFGLDRSPSMVREATRIVTHGGPHPIALNIGGTKSVAAMLDIDWHRPNVGFAVADAQALPVADNSIDMIVCLNVLDRIRHPKQMIAEFYRVLRPQGILLMTDPYHWDEQYTHLDEWVENMTELFLATRWKVEDEIDGVPFIVRYEPRRVTLYQNHCLLYSKL